MKRSVLIAGVGGASLGTELFKSLKLSGNYNIIGADISPYAYGLYQEGSAKTYVADKDRYIQSILQICKREKVDAILPGGGEPLLLLYKNKDVFDQEGILLAINSIEAIELCNDKLKTFEYLSSQGVPVPLTKQINSVDELDDFDYPCIVKPSIESGGSIFVYVAEDKEEAQLYVSYLNKRDIAAIVQEYIPHDEGAYSTSVLSLPNGEIVWSIALKKSFQNKLSFHIRYDGRIISSPYSQGLVDDFKDIRMQVEKIAQKIDSRGPLNIQGRLKNGVFYPFELNARFSGGTYLRAMAGFNEVDIFLQYLFEQRYAPPEEIKYGYYIRSLEERYVSYEEVKT